LIRIVNGLMRRKQGFDAIIIETTGLADPGPVAQTFFVDQDIRSKTRLDSVTTVVDAKHILLRLADSKEAREQIAFADQIVLNKTDLVAEPELVEVERRIRILNPLAPIHRAVRSNVPLDAILERGGFDLERMVDLDPHIVNPAHGEPGHVHAEDCVVQGDAALPKGRDSHDAAAPRGHAHDDQDIRGVALTLDRPLDSNRVTQWLNELLQRQGPDILRAKGILDVAGEDRRLVFQAVHMILEGELQRPWKTDERRYSRLVFIGRNLNEAALKRDFEAAAA
jgi:G3E family GTPase